MESLITYNKNPQLCGFYECDSMTVCKAIENQQILHHPVEYYFTDENYLQILHRPVEYYFTDENYLTDILEEYVPKFKDEKSRMSQSDDYYHADVLEEYFPESADEKSKLHKCVECEYETKYKGNLNRHFKSAHIKEKPYKCEYEGCNHEFSQKNNLTIHIRKHTGEKPYKCKHEECDYETHHRSSLHNHMKKHMKIEPADLK